MHIHAANAHTRRGDTHGHAAQAAQAAQEGHLTAPPNLGPQAVTGLRRAASAQYISAY
ncbi:Hypothetical protein CAP_8981 [Chondromyces apiculatus DSM 436]|uniref:Uncharacterized protein n=1 Tax=Chondromyces apiculatus DSM 436 TaxID=1192034 RepID=A0A017SW28_9BACT|nr:Hypothetical protein CAP_8981 [Chondromyces apiculatus DSM 436]